MSIRPLFLMATVLFCLGMAEPALAQMPAICNFDMTSGQYTAQVVNCVQTAALGSIITMMNALSAYMTPIVGVLTVLAIVMFGMRILYGEQELVPRAVGFVMRMAIVLLFSASLGASWFPYPGGLVQALFDIEGQLLTLAAGNYSPWVQIDSLVGTLFGFAPGLALFQGFIGLLGAAVFSPWLGFMLAIVGISVLIDLLLLAFDSVFTYLEAILVMAFLLILSPIIVPLALFYHTERYVKKWMDMLIAAMLTPILLFAFLSITFIMPLNIAAQIFTILGGNDFSAYEVANRPVFSWLMPADPNFNMLLGKQDPNGLYIPPVNPAINPFAQNVSNANVFNLPAINFGPNTWFVMQNLVLNFIILLLLTHFMRQALKHIPGIANSIAGAVGGVSGQPSALSQKVRGGIQDMKDRIGAMRGNAGAGAG